MDFALADCEFDKGVQRLEDGSIRCYALYSQWKFLEI